MHYCKNCKFYVGPLKACSLVNPVSTDMHDCKDYEEEVYLAPNLYRYWDAIANIKLIGTKGFENLPRVIKGFFPNRYLIGVVKGMAAFYVPWLQEDHQTSMRIAKMDPSLQVFNTRNEEDDSSPTRHSSLVFVTRNVSLKENRREFLRSLGLDFSLTTYRGGAYDRHYLL